MKNLTSAINRIDTILKDLQPHEQLRVVDFIRGNIVDGWHQQKPAPPLGMIGAGAAGQEAGRTSRAGENSAADAPAR